MLIVGRARILYNSDTLWMVDKSLYAAQLRPIAFYESYFVFIYALDFEIYKVVSNLLYYTNIIMKKLCLLVDTWLLML